MGGSRDVGCRNKTCRRSFRKREVSDALRHWGGQRGPGGATRREQILEVGGGLMVDWHKRKGDLPGVEYWCVTCVRETNLDIFECWLCN